MADTPSTPSTPDSRPEEILSDLAPESPGSELSRGSPDLAGSSTKSLLSAPPMETHSLDSSDSENGRERLALALYSSALESESQMTLNPKGLRKKRAPSSIASTPTQGARKSSSRTRRRASEVVSDKSHRLDLAQGGGYKLTPATGKIFRNLLILEESLRQQAIQQRTLRRKYLTFLAALSSLIASISHHLYFASTSGALRVFLQLILLMLVVTLLLYHLSGEYQKTIVLPKRFLLSTNKGLRQLNVRLVRSKSLFANTAADLTREFGLFLCTMALKLFHSTFPSMVRNPNSKLEVWLVSGQLRCQPRVGLNDIKLVLIPRSFSTDIREGWELYRDEFWLKEGMRRRQALLDFAQAPVEEKKMTLKKEKEKKEKRKRKVSSPQQPSLSEQNLKSLDRLSSESPVLLA